MRGLGCIYLLASASAAPARSTLFGRALNDKCDEFTPRVRRNYLTLSREERDLFFEAVNKLKETGQYDHFVYIHGSPTNNVAAHMTAHFPFWHRKFLLEFENALRALGDKYSCITIPYWNWALDGDACRTLSQAKPINDQGKLIDCNSYLGPPAEEMDSLKDHFQFPFPVDPFQVVREHGGPGDEACSTSPMCAKDSNKYATIFGNPSCKDDDGWGPITCTPSQGSLAGQTVQRGVKGFSAAAGDRAVGCVNNGPYEGWMTPDLGQSADEATTCLSRATNFTITRPDTGSSGDFNTTVDFVDLIVNRPKYGPYWGSGEGDPRSPWRVDAGFRLGLEMRPHVMGHGINGGHMISYESPGDPIFWMHHSHMERVFTLWQDCHDYEDGGESGDPGWLKNGAFDAYTTIETGRYWWNKAFSAWDEPTYRSINGHATYTVASAGTVAEGATLSKNPLFARGPYFDNQNHPPYDTADPSYMADHKGIVNDTIDSPMRFTYPSQATTCFLGPEFDRSPGGCYECMVKINPSCRSTWKDQELRGVMVLEDACLFACGYKECADICRTTHELLPDAMQPEQFIHTWNPENHIKNYWDVRRLPSYSDKGNGASVTYATDTLADALADTQTCNLRADISGVTSSNRNEFAGTYVYRAVLPANDLNTGPDVFLGFGYFYLQADPQDPKKLKGTLTGGNIGAILLVDAEVSGTGENAAIQMRSHVKDYGGVVGNNWEYHYSLRPQHNWANAIDQDGFRYRRGLVGSVVRFMDGHDGGRVHEQGITATVQLTKL